MESIKEHQGLSGIFSILGFLFYFVFRHVDTFTASALFAYGFICALVFVIFTTWRFVLSHRKKDAKREQLSDMTK